MEKRWVEVLHDMEDQDGFFKAGEQLHLWGFVHAADRPYAVVVREGVFRLIPIHAIKPQ